MASHARSELTAQIIGGFRIRKDGKVVGHAQILQVYCAADLGESHLACVQHERSPARRWKEPSLLARSRPRIIYAGRLHPGAARSTKGANVARELQMACYGHEGRFR